MNASFRVRIVVSLVLISTAVTACRSRTDKGRITPILLFNGTGTSPNDVAALEALLNRNDLSYSTANSAQLNEMDESQLRGYRLLIVPGGNFIDIGKGLTSSTTATIRGAVQNGLNYLGICAGGFFAGNSGFNGLNLTSGVRFRFYSAEDQGIRKAAVAIAAAGSPTLDHYWEDGPQFAGWGAVVGKYPDGTPPSWKEHSGAGGWSSAGFTRRLRLVGGAG